MVVERDLDIVGRFARTVQARTRWGRAIGAVDLADGFADAVREELDFRIEAGNMVAVGAAATDPDVVYPVPHNGLRTARILVMERLHGTPLSAAEPVIVARGLDRIQLARTLLRCVLRQVVLGGVFHADPHPGNVLLLTDGRLGLLDFGSVGRLDMALRGALQRLLLAVDQGDPAALTDALLDVVGRPDEIDEKRLERSLGQFMGRHLGAGMAPDARMFTDLFKVVSAYGLAIPPEVAGVFRALGTLEAGLAQVAPGFDMVTEACAFARAYLAEQLTPEAVRRTMTDELVMLLPILRRLPRRLDRVAGALERGRLGINVRLFADERDRRHVTGLLHQALLTILGATTGIMAVLLLGTGRGVLGGQATGRGRVEGEMRRKRVEVEAEHPRQGGNGEEGRGGDRAALDLAEGIEGDPGVVGHVGGAARPSGPLEQSAQLLPAQALAVGQRCPYHAVILILVLVSLPWSDSRPRASWRPCGKPAGSSPAPSPPCPPPPGPACAW